MSKQIMYIEMGSAEKQRLPYLQFSCSNGFPFLNIYKSLVDSVLNSQYLHPNTAGAFFALERQSRPGPAARCPVQDDPGQWTWLDVWMSGHVNYSHTCYKLLSFNLLLDAFKVCGCFFNLQRCRDLCFGKDVL